MLAMFYGSIQRWKQRTELCITIMHHQWSSFTWDWKQVWHFREVAWTNTSRKTFPIPFTTSFLSRQNKKRNLPQVVIQRLRRWGLLICTFFSFFYLSNHHPAHSCAPWADMSLISEGHARQPTQRVSSLSLKITAERAVIAVGDRERRKRVVLSWVSAPYLSISWYNYPATRKEAESVWRENEKKPPETKTMQKRKSSFYLLSVTESLPYSLKTSEKSACAVTTWQPTSNRNQLFRRK